MDSRCIFKAFGVILVHFVVDKTTQGVFSKRQRLFWQENGVAAPFLLDAFLRHLESFCG
jgi:hypothetical protein